MQPAESEQTVGLFRDHPWHDGAQQPVVVLFAHPVPPGVRHSRGTAGGRQAQALVAGKPWCEAANSSQFPPRRSLPANTVGKLTARFAAAHRNVGRVDGRVRTPLVKSLCLATQLTVLLALIKRRILRSRYGPPGLAERAYEDLYGPFGPNAVRSQPPQFLRTRSAEGVAKGHRGYGPVRTLAVAGRIQTPPHDLTAAQPHPSGHNLSFTGTWRASGKEHQESGMSSARECVHRLLTGTTPAPASRPAVRTQIVPRPTAAHRI